MDGNEASFGIFETYTILYLALQLIYVMIEEYNDVNWITESNKVKFTNEYVFTFGRRAVTWKSSKTDMYRSLYNET